MWHLTTRSFDPLPTNVPLETSQSICSSSQLTPLYIMGTLAVNDRKSHRRFSVKKVFLKNFANFTSKHLWSFFLIKLQD